MHRVVDRCVHPGFLPADRRANKGSATGACDTSQRERLELDRGPVLAFGKLGGRDVFDLLLKLRNETGKVLGQSGADQSSEKIVVSLGTELGVSAHQCLLACQHPIQFGLLLRKSDLADGFRRAENLFWEAFQLAQKFRRDQDLDALGGLDLIDLIVELSDVLEEKADTKL